MVEAVALITKLDAGHLLARAAAPARRPIGTSMPKVRHYELATARSPPVDVGAIWALYGPCFADKATPESTLDSSTKAAACPAYDERIAAADAVVGERSDQVGTDVQEVRAAADGAEQDVNLSYHEAARPSEVDAILEVRE
jgi:hypothetical protein